MNSKILNTLGIITVFIGLFSLLSLHISHHLLDESISSGKSEENHQEKEDLSKYNHLFIGFPVSVLGAILLILAEKQEKKE